MKENTVITISRQYGCGGRELAEILAKKLNVNLYDRQIVHIAAAKLGAKTVKAVDIDATAVRVAIENIAGNELTEKISVQQGDLLHGTEGKADIIIANIIADIIIMLLQDIPGKLKSGGIFLASGIIEERQNDVSAAASKVGLCVEAVDAKGGWVVMQMRKED